MQQQRHDHRTALCDLPDSCLLHVFKHLCPLPDKFSVGACCWRFYRLVSDRRLWLVVSPSGVVPESAPGIGGPVYTTIEAAVKASRPGDTLWLAPGVTHTAADVDIPWPLHLLGGGPQLSDTWISTPLTADCALSFSASAKVAQLSIAATLCPCVVHKRGSLTLQNCMLASEPKGLHHLVSPVLTLAVSTVGRRGSSDRLSNIAPAATAQLRSAERSNACAAAAAAAAGGEALCAGAFSDAIRLHGGALALEQPALGAASASASGALVCDIHTHSSTTSTTTTISSSSSRAQGSAMLCRPPTGLGPGKLQVVECQLMGGSTAVRCGGTGTVSNVRAIYESCSKAPYFWLDVDSKHSASAVRREMPGVMEQRPATVPAVGQGPWQASDGLSQQQQQQQQQSEPVGTAVAASAAAAAAVVEPEPDSSSASSLLQQRSKAWQQKQQQAALPTSGGPPGCPSVGLTRIQAVLGGRSINPASLTAHLIAKRQS